MIRTKTQIGGEHGSTERLAKAWPTSIERQDVSLASTDRQISDDDELEPQSEVALLCANIQADVGQPTPFGDLAGLLQALYALTTALTTTETHPNRTR